MDLFSDPARVIGAVSDRSTQILPTDHPSAGNAAETFFAGALLIRDAAVRIEDLVLKNAIRLVQSELRFEHVGESLKSLEKAEWLSQNLARQAPSSVVVIGSGSLLNLATYAVAGQEHPIDLTMVPTNAMSIADVAFGGLGLVNDKSKNDVRKNRDPDCILLSRSVFANAPKTQQQDGQIEVIKHLLFQQIAQGEKTLCQLLHHMDDMSPDALFESATLGLKLNILLRYAIEAGETSAKSVLTFGHSHAHVLERQSGYSLAHSEAVRFGMAVDCAFSRPDLTAELRASAAWSDLLVKTVRATLGDEQLLNASLYDAKYLDRKCLLCALPKTREFPYKVDLDSVEISSVAAKMEEVLL